MELVGKTFGYVAVAFAGLIVLAAIAGPVYLGQAYLGGWWLGLLSLAVMVPLSLLLFKRLDRLELTFKKHFGSDKRKYAFAFVGILSILLILQSVMLLYADFIPINDLRHVTTAAANLVEKGTDHLHDGLPERHQHYFAVYKNNHMICLMMSLLFRVERLIFGRVIYFLPVVFNVFCLDISLVFMYLCARLLYSEEKALTCAVKGLLFTPLITYAPMYYTDSLAMPWITLAFYLFLRYRRANAEPDNGSEPVSGRRRAARAILLAALVGAAAAVGYMIKGSALLIFPALILDMLLRRKVRGLIDAAVMLIVFAVIVRILSFSAAAALGISREDSDKYAFPTVHWIMMSADGVGGYKADDFAYTHSFEGHDAKVKADLDRLKQKINDQGPLRFTGHLFVKVGVTWADGAYMAWYYYNFRYNRSLFFRSIYFMLIAEIFNFALLFGVFRGFLDGLSRKKDMLSDSFVFRLTFMALFCFLLLWEAKSRYLVSFMLLFCLPVKEGSVQEGRSGRWHFGKKSDRKAALNSTK